MRTIRHIVDRQARERPDARWLIAPETGATMTFAQLQRNSQDLTRFLIGAGLKKGDKVALMLHNSYQTARLLIGVMYGGFMVAPLNLLAQPSQLTYVLQHSDTRIIFTSEEFADRLEAALEGLDHGITIIAIDPDATSLFEHAHLPDTLLPDVKETDDALLMYTSGTTGKPKGCVLSNRSVCAGGEFTSSAHELSAKDRVLCAMPLYHINGQIVTTVAPLVHGGSVVMPQRFSVSNYWELVAKHQCTWINVVPTIIAYLMNAPTAARWPAPASAPLPPELHRAFEDKFGIGIIETFGMTETNAPCFTNPYDPKQRKIGSPGTAYGNEAKVIDPNTGKEQSRGTPGELMLRGDNVMTGYYKDPENTAKTLEPDGWLHSGDLGYMDDDGFVFVTGRIKELIIKGGENIAPREIDEALLKHPAVLEAAAVGIPDANYGQEIMACVILKPGMECSIETLTAFSKKELGPYKTPKVIKFVSELPKGPSGKVQRLKLLES